MVVVTDLVGHLLDAHGRVGQQLLGLAHPHLVDETRRRKPCVLLKGLTERGIAKAKLSRHLLRRDRHVVVVYDDLGLTYLIARVRLLEQRVPVVEIGHAEHPVNNPGQYLLESRFLVHRRRDRRVVEIHKILMDVDLEGRLVLGKKALADQIVHKRAVETDPVLLPPGGLVRIVGVPLPGEQQEHHPASDRDGLGTSQRLAEELAVALRDVQELVLLKHPSAGH